MERKDKMARKAKEIYVNLPVKDLQKSIDFFYCTRFWL